MTTTTAADPRFEATDQYDLLSLVVDEHTPLPSKADAIDLFLTACQRDANTHDGIVSVSRVAELLAEDLEHDRILHHQYSAMWSRYTGKDRPMRKATTDDVDHPWEVREGSKTGNNGKPFRLRVWVGFPTEGDRT